ncbi:MAG: chemotaxis response regulator protein-glutamate methylesterase [Pseudomonadota bacterium]|nr:chemotaxis response regulator protein-glutamate methylesterase [Pseudomonadota bacterium]
MLSSLAEAGARGVPIRVLIVDDSALIRRVLTDIISRQPDMTVVGAAHDAIAARDLIKSLNPDVLTLDIEMPHMSGLEFLEKLMHLRPMPVIMVSTLTREGSEAALRALELGAVDFVAKPMLDVASGMEQYADEIVAKLRMAARVSRRRAREPIPSTPLPAFAGRGAASDAIIVIGASTGGTEALRSILQRLPHDAPPVLVTQHMPPGYTHTFAARLDKVCPMIVAEAVDGTPLRQGHVYIARGGTHLEVVRRGAGHVLAITHGEPVNRHKPSVDVLFASAAREIGSRVIAVILTGMGKDGAHGMLAIRDAGGETIAQDEATSVVFGMPREAIALGGVAEVLPLPAIPARIVAIAATAGRVSATS